MTEILFLLGRKLSFVQALIMITIRQTSNDKLTIWKTLLITYKYVVQHRVLNHSFQSRLALFLFCF